VALLAPIILIAMSSDKDTRMHQCVTDLVRTLIQAYQTKARVNVAKLRMTVAAKYK
jgi:hypothetical protein